MDTEGNKLLVECGCHLANNKSSILVDLSSTIALTVLMGLHNEPRVLA